VLRSAANKFGLKKDAQQLIASEHNVKNPRGISKSIYHTSPRRRLSRLLLIFRRLKHESPSFWEERVKQADLYIYPLTERGVFRIYMNHTSHKLSIRQY
jgi:hypothetical protein